MSDIMTFPETVDEFIEEYGIRDTEEVYTNGRMLISVFRVKQMIDHYFPERTCKPVEKDGVMRCPDCDYPLGIMSVPAYCAGCGAKVVEE